MEPAVVLLSAHDYRFDAPDTIVVGYTSFRFVNESDQLHMAHLLMLDSGRTVHELLDAYGAGDPSARTVRPTFTDFVKRVPWARRFGGPAADAHATSAEVIQHLPAGRYAWICLRSTIDGVSHFSRGMTHPFVVRPTEDTAQPAMGHEAEVVIRLTDYAFAVSSPLTVGRTTIRVENIGPEPHELALLKLEPGKTMADFLSYLDDPQGPAPASRVAGVTALDPTLEAYLDVDLTRGDYVLACFISAPDGRSHIAHGMIRHIHVA